MKQLCEISTSNPVFQVRIRPVQLQEDVVGSERDLLDRRAPGLKLRPHPDPDSRRPVFRHLPDVLHTDEAGLCFFIYLLIFANNRH